MIVSHARRFIFIKTQKTAGTSIEVALSALCGPDDVLTPIQSWIEGERSDHAGRGPQNYRLSHPLVPKRAWWKRLAGRPERHYHPSIGYYDHMPAWRVKAYVGDAVWSSYFKFAFERNPWDRQVSWYRYKTKSKTDGKRPDFARFLADRRRAYVDNHDLYSIDGTVAVDFLGRYENLEADFAEAMRRAGVREDVALPRVNVSKGGATDYRAFYDEASRALVADWYAREIALLDYHF